MKKKLDILAFEAAHGIITLPIREDVEVQISKLPHDLTKDEAERIARVVAAYALLAPEPKP